MKQDIPEGFSPHFRKSGMTDPWEPLYSRNTGDAIFLGLRAGPAHANSRGFGQWLEIRPVVLKSGRNLSFCAATVHANDTLCARANATFRALMSEKSPAS